MKFIFALALATAGLAAAQPHRHVHRHVHEKKNPSPVADAVEAPGPTVIAYELNGHLISEGECEEGIKNGTLVWADNEDSAVSSSSVYSPTPTPTPTPTPSTTSVHIANYQAQVEASSTSCTEEETPTSTYVTPKPSPTVSSSTNQYSLEGTGMDAEFPDGELDCSTFPSEYGALYIDWLGIGGWTGIQVPQISGASGYDAIVTVDSSACSDGSCCTEGAFCSYACPAGYQKSQWPELQGATAQSVGGLQCKNGKLYLTNPSLSKKLCITGTDSVSIKVESKLGNGNGASICRTDYPGTESETVPLWASHGSTQDLTCPDTAHYYKWQGKGTSAQYYINPLNIAPSKACQWGSQGDNWGNYAPVNLGVGYDSGRAWLAIFQNYPTTEETLDFSIEIQGDNVVGKCKYENGQFCSGDNYENCNTREGCTVSIDSGCATFVLYQ